MATLLKKDIVRETYGVTNRAGKKMIVTLKAGDMLEFRAKGKRIRYEVPLASCYIMAMIQYVEDQYKDKIRKYNEKKKLGMRTRIPKRPARLFTKKWYDALNIKV